MAITAYTHAISPQHTPQSDPLPGRESSMHLNAAGGFVFTVDDWTRLDRFLLLGSEKGTYYTGERELTRENAACVERCIKDDGEKTVRRIVDISANGRAPKNDSAIFALALIAKTGDDTARKAALDALPLVCRTGTHLFAFAEAVQAFGGWGRGTRAAVAKWYADKQPKDLAYQLTKYQQRNGWTHRDLLRLSHAKPLPGGVYNSLYKYVVKGEWVPEYTMGPSSWEGGGDIVLGGYLNAVQQLKTATDLPHGVKDAARLIRDHKLPREVVPTEYLNSADVWDALMVDMPLTAMMRNLATMTRVGLIAPLSDATRTVRERLSDKGRLHKARIHPMNVLMALKTYSAGHGLKGQNTWTPVQAVVDALDEAFYASMDVYEPTGKKWLVAVDCSGSMGAAVGGMIGLSAKEAAAAMALVTVRTEPETYVLGFTTQPYELRISPSMRLDDVLRTLNAVNGGTDCSIPMKYATYQGIPADAFALLTDNETWHGTTHPSVALEAYRQKVGRNAYFISVGLTATSGTVADIDDPRALSIVGFDSMAPSLMADFVRI